MANKRKEKEYLDLDALVSIIANRAGFTKGDVALIFAQLRPIIEECVIKDINIDLHGIFHMEVVDIEYTKPPGIVAYRGRSEFNNKAKRVKYIVPENVKNIAREMSRKENGFEPIKRTRDVD